MSLIFKEVKFTKMHGAGNDYVYVDCTKEEMPDRPDRLARIISDRHCGIGSDGLVFITKSDKADFKMRMFNADGSEAQMCGNASRCIGKFVFDKGLTSKREITLETQAGVKNMSLHIDSAKVKSVTVDMGIPEFDVKKIPALCDSERMIAHNIAVNGKDYKLTAVSMGNPHGVIFVDGITDSDVLQNGKVLESVYIWPEKANIEFARVISPKEIEMRVWERGSGETMACGTGACAVLAAAVVNNLTERSVTVHLLGGDLQICWDDQSGHIYMTGGATIVADGVFYIDSAADNNFIKETI